MYPLAHGNALALSSRRLLDIRSAGGAVAEDVLIPEGTEVFHVEVSKIGEGKERKKRRDPIVGPPLILLLETSESFDRRLH